MSFSKRLIYCHWSIFLRHSMSRPHHRYVFSLTHRPKIMGSCHDCSDITPLVIISNQIKRLIALVLAEYKSPAVRNINLTLNHCIHTRSVYVIYRSQGWIYISNDRKNL